MKIVVINGHPGVGKDEFVKACQRIIGEYRCYNLSTVTCVKNFAKKMGWDGTKTPKNRKFLSDLKDLLTQWNDVPHKEILKEIKIIQSDFETFGIKEGIAFIHCREPKEIDRFVDELNACTLLIQRQSVGSLDQSNHADKEVNNYCYDYTIHNDGTIEDLEKEAKKFLANINIM